MNFGNQPMDELKKQIIQHGGGVIINGNWVKLMFGNFTRDIRDCQEEDLRVFFDIIKNYNIIDDFNASPDHVRSWCELEVFKSYAEKCDYWNPVIHIINKQFVQICDKMNYPDNVLLYNPENHFNIKLTCSKNSGFESEYIIGKREIIICSGGCEDFDDCYENYQNMGKMLIINESINAFIIFQIMNIHKLLNKRCLPRFIIQLIFLFVKMTKFLELINARIAIVGGFLTHINGDHIKYKNLTIQADDKLGQIYNIINMICDGFTLYEILSEISRHPFYYWPVIPTKYRIFSDDSMMFLCKFNDQEFWYQDNLGNHWIRYLIRDQQEIERFYLF